jgi:glycerate 2-kinase
MSRELLKQLYFHALDKVKADAIVRDNIGCDEDNLKVCQKNISWNSFKNLYIFSVGKAGYDMAKKSEEILKNRIYDGVAISLKDEKLEHIQTFQSSHPILTDKSIESAELLIETMSKMDKDDFFIFFLSGGASAMIEKPIENIDLENFQKISRALIGSGIDITVFNSVRKAISKVKGGKLANYSKASGITLVLSDVIGDDLNTIGSAPMNNGIIEHKIIGNNLIALNGAKEYIQKELDHVEILTHTLDLDSIAATEFISTKIKEYNNRYESYCLLLGGETITKIVGDGLGGRNQELALRLLLQNCINPNTFILCAGSDGIDGNAPATGAFIDFDIYKKIEELELDPIKFLDNSDSYSFFKLLGYDFTIGVTGTNVMDFIMIVKKRN